MKQKVYVLMISRVFPTKHPKAGQFTHFRERIFIGQGKAVPMHHENWKGAGGIIESPNVLIPFPKITTIRSNYALWAKRAEKINRGEAILSLRQWSGKPYASKQVEFLRLDKIGVQKVSFKIRHDEEVVGFDSFISPSIMQVTLPQVKKYGSIPMRDNVEVPRSHLEFFQLISKNDGLNDYDFKNWFKKDMDGVIIHFSNFRY